MALVYAAMRAELPDSVATHWGTGGGPNGRLSHAGFLTLLGGIWLLFVLLSFGRKRYQLGHWGQPVSLRQQLLTGYFGGGVVAGVFTVILAANRGVPSGGQRTSTPASASS